MYRSILVTGYTDLDGGERDGHLEYRKIHTLRAIPLRNAPNDVIHCPRCEGFISQPAAGYLVDHDVVVFTSLRSIFNSPHNCD